LRLKSFETALVIAKISLYVIHIAGRATELMINLANYPLEVRQLHGERVLSRCEVLLSLSDLPNFDSNGFQRFAQWRGHLEKSRIDFVSEIYKLTAVSFELDAMRSKFAFEGFDPSSKKIKRRLHQAK